MAKRPPKQDRVDEVIRAIHRMDQRRVLVGFPEGAHDRSNSEINNASLAYIHEHGSPAANIPARPFLTPGIEDAEDAVVAEFRQGAAQALTSNNPDAVLERTLNRVGLIAVGSVQKKIVTGPFVPLKPATIRRKGSSKPLIDTGQMRQAVSYVIRDRQ